MSVEFNIIDYLSGITGFLFPKEVLQCIALEREVHEVTSYDELDTKTKELLKADLLYAAYLSPNVWASANQAHGSFSRSIGSQTTHTEDKKRLYKIFMGIYKKYEDPKYDELSEEGTLQWLDY